MTLPALEKAVEDFNRSAINRINGMTPPNGYTGASHVPTTITHPSHFNLRLSTSSTTNGCIFIATIDDNARTPIIKNLPVVLAIGANYGQGPKYITYKTSGKVLDATGMYSNAKIVVLKSRLGKGDFYLVAFNVFPWITPHPWTSPFNRPVRYSASPLGFHNPTAEVSNLITAIQPDLIIFHGKEVWRDDFLRIMYQTAQANPKTQAFLSDNLSYGSSSIELS